MVRKLLKILGKFTAALLAVIVVVGFAVYISSNVVLHKNYAVNPRSIGIPVGDKAVERGHHLAISRGCVDCHGADFAGAKVIDDVPMGKVYGANLTPGAGGLAGYTDQDWVRAIRHGIARDGHGLFIMPSDEYSHLNDYDVGALVAYMKTLKPVDKPREPIALGPVSRILLVTGKMSLAAEKIDHPNVRPRPIAPAASAEYGQYLAVACTGCHGPNLSGGKIEIGPPDWPPARNLTPHPSGNLAKWTENDFIRAIRESKRPDGTEVILPMPRGFAAMSDLELGALWAFLQTLPPVATGVR